MSQMPHPSHDVPGTLRRAPAGFAHAICLDQMGKPQRWQINDRYGRQDNTLAVDNDVADWPIVYTPATPEQWANNITHLPAPPTSITHTDAQETTR